MTVQDLAMAVGGTSVSINTYISGKAAPQLKKAVLIQEAIGMPVEAWAPHLAPDLEKLSPSALGPDAEPGSLAEQFERHGLLQTEVAWTIGVSQPTVACWKSGRSRPSIDYALLLRRLYHVPVESWYEPTAADRRRIETVKAAVEQRLDRSVGI